MKGKQILTILVLSLGLMVWPASVVSGAQYLTVNGQDVTSITLELGQSCTVEVVADSNDGYKNRLVGFDNGVVLGTFSHLETRPEAGSTASVAQYNEPAFSGYRFTALGENVSVGVHFVFEYMAQELGTTYVKLYDTLFLSVIDTVHITVTPAPHLRVNGQEGHSITLEQGQSSTVEVVSAGSTSYVGYVGFQNGLVLGDFSHVLTLPEAGNLATVAEYNQPDFYGYYINAAGSSPPPSAGVHFVFEYVAQEFGATDVILYDETLTSVRDWMHVTVIPATMGTAFTYQGRLLDSNKPADGLYDFQLKLYNHPYAGTQEGNTIDINDLDVIEGQFTVELDFGSDVFAGDARWLEIAVRPSDSNDPNAFVTLSPRQEVTPTPYALYAKTAGADGDWQISGGDMYSIPSGKIGIGKTNPQVKLDVDGSINTDVVYKIGGSTVLSTTATENTFVGINAGANNTTGSYNTFLGFLAGWYNITGNYNTAMGSFANRFNMGGSRNTIIGYYAGRGTSVHNKSGNVFIGYKAGYDETGDNKLYIANGPSDANVLIYGDFSTGHVGIGTTSPQAQLHIGGTPGVDGIMFPDGTLQTTAASGAFVPIGAVLDWWRPNATFAVPDGYQICDGSVVNDAQSPFNGQTLPDLRNKFVRGADTVNDIGQTGGANTHMHSISGSTASKVVTMGYSDSNFYIVPTVGTMDIAQKNHRHPSAPHSHESGTIATSNVSHLPPYVGLLKIMRIR